VPEEFRSIARRSYKRLLDQRDPKLLAAYTAFVSALNSGADEDDLIDLGDGLGDAYLDSRTPG